MFCLYRYFFFGCVGGKSVLDILINFWVMLGEEFRFGREDLKFELFNNKFVV